MAPRLLQFAHLCADGLHRHVQPIGGSDKAALLGDNREVVRVAAVQHVRYSSEKPNLKYKRFWFIQIMSVPILPRVPSLFNHPTMFYALSWLVVVAMLALWSLVAWALHAVAVWTVSNAGALSGAVSGVVPGAGALALPEWLAPWVPPELVQAITQLMADLGPVVDSLLQAAPGLASGLTVAAWVTWGIGSALLILLGVGLHLVIVMWRRRGGGLRPQPTR